MFISINKKMKSILVVNRTSFEVSVTVCATGGQVSIFTTIYLISLSFELKLSSACSASTVSTQNIFESYFLNKQSDNNANIGYTKDFQSTTRSGRCLIQLHSFT